MKHSVLVSVILGALMLSAGALSKHLTPTARLSDSHGKTNLAAIVPTAFGEWAIDTTITPLQIDADTQSKLDLIYNQTLSRTYVNKAGQHVMLSLAYGGDQSDKMSVHKPEVCYAAQGFEVKKEAFADVGTPFGAIPVKRLFAVNGNRNEPITYWITVGDKAVRPGFAQKLQQLRYGMTGTVPDGMLVRVSTIDADLGAAYQVQDKFIGDLLQSLSPEGRTRLAGSFGAVN